MKLHFRILALFGLLFVVACSGGGSSSTGSTGTGTTTAIGGSAVKGPMSSATVNVYAVNADGTDGTSLATATTDSAGHWTASIDATAATHPVRVKITAGTYSNESNPSSTVTNAATFTAMADLGDSTVVSHKANLSITPITTFIDARAKHLAAAGAALSAAVTTATTAIKSHLGITHDPLTTTVNLSDPAAVTTNPDGTAIGLVLGALTAEAGSLGVSDPGILITALANDFADGVFDGKSGATAVTLTGSTPLPIGAGSTDLMASLTSYIGNPAGTAGAGGITSSVASAISSTVNGGISGSTATPPSLLTQANVSTSASAAVYTSGTSQKVYIAGKSTSKGVIVYDSSKAITTSSTIPATTASTSNPRLLLIQDPAQSTVCSSTATSSCFKVDGLVVMNNFTRLVLFSYSSTYVVFLDLTNEQVATTNGSLNTGLASQGSWSGGSAYIAGMIGDNNRGGIWFSAADGYYFLNMNPNPYTATKKFPITGGTNYVAENMGANIADTAIGGHAGYLWTPNYNGYSGVGIDLIDLAGTGTDYKVDATTASYITGSTGVIGGSSWYFSMPDHGAVDTKLNVAFVTPEDASGIVMMDLNQAVLTPTTAGAGTFSVPTTAINKFSMSTENPIISGVTVESSQHVALFMAAYGNDRVATLQLDAAAASPTAVKDYVVIPIGYYYLSSDPHSVAIMADAAGKVIGIIPATGSKFYMLNLTNLLNGTTYPRTSTTDHTMTTTAVTAATTAGDINPIYY